ncbi:AAA family ATPase [Actinokineospora sp. HUAS TT18]|uniref:AAA family ATPase n=1 Tax=Actinokineospora sp. HUAS TT18 TaxID=3447451 RepID=UPI003F51EA17
MAVDAPPYLLRLHVRNFRSLRSVDLELGALNVLVGPNGAGKSNLLDVISFLGDSVRQDIGPAISKRGGINRVRFRGQGRSGAVLITVETAVTKHSSPKASDQYTLSFYPMPRKDGSFYLRRREEFLFKRTPGRGRRITISGGDISVLDDNEKPSLRQNTLRSDSLGLSTLPKLGVGSGGEQVNEIAELFASFRVFDVNVERARQPSSVVADMHINDDASNLAAFLYYLQHWHAPVFDELVEDARFFIPGLKAIEFSEIGGAGPATVVRIAEQGLRAPTDLADMSYGSIRALALLALLYDPEPPQLTCIEEIDHGLHPHVLDRLVELLRRASKRTQLLIATHSPPLVNRLNADELIICERQDDASSLIPATDPQLIREIETDLQGEMGLGEIWFSGALGGVPE